jgi:hypothetical protein
MREAFRSEEGDTGEADVRRAAQRTGPSGPQPAAEDDYTKTAFRPDIVRRADEARGSARQSPKFVDAGGMQQQRSRAPALMTGILLGGMVLGGAWWLSQRGGRDADTVADAGVTTGEMELLIEAAPHTTRIGIVGKPDQRFVTPAKVKGMVGETLSIMYIMSS